MAGNQDWETPWNLFNLLDEKFNFTIDGAADALNSKCDAYISEKHNAHKVELQSEVIFCNPPYNNMDPWVDTFLRWSTDNIVVILCQDRTDTNWFKRLWKEANQVWFLHKRVNFIGTVTGNNRGATIFVLGTKQSREVRLWDWSQTEELW